MIGAGTIIAPIIKVVTTVAILAAVYFLFLRPILDTAEETTRGINQGFGGPSEANITAERSRAQNYARSVLAGSQPWFEASKAIKECVSKAGGSAIAMRKCANLGQTITTGTLSARNFAISYADSLEAQGKTNDAARVRDCVEKAGFKPAPMAKCRALADDLLFG